MGTPGNVRRKSSDAAAFVTRPRPDAAAKPRSWAGIEPPRAWLKVKRRLRAKFQRKLSRIPPARAKPSARPPRERRVRTARFTSVPDPPTARNCKREDQFGYLKVRSRRR